MTLVPTTFVPKNALISVSNKDGITEFAQALITMGWKIWASGGTARTLGKAGLEVNDVAAIVGEAILDHRVVTLSREIHAGLLARATEVDLATLEAIGVPYFDLVCVDFYPLAAAIAKPDATHESVIEATDIGGPTIVRSAVKGGRIVIVDPADRGRVLEFLANGGVDVATNQALAAKAEATVSHYVYASAIFLSHGWYHALFGNQVSTCKYGENPWQTPAIHFKLRGDDDPLALDQFRLVAGTSPSFNNLNDLDRGLQTITHIAAGWQKNFGTVPAIAVGIKHGNACGASVEPDGYNAIRGMTAGDPEALFGGVVITNFGLDEYHARELVEYYENRETKHRVLDMVVAPEFTEAALKSLSRKNGKCRILINPALWYLDETTLDQGQRVKSVRGGYLGQPNFTFILDLSTLDKVTERREIPVYEQNAYEKQDLVLAWAIGSTSTSNTITIVDAQKLLGNGVGQQSRTAAVQLAITRARAAGHKLNLAVAYSDSFFPFRDGLDQLADADITTILASSGSVRDKELAAAAAERNLNLYWIPDAIGRGFYH